MRVREIYKRIIAAKAEAEALVEDKEWQENIRVARADVDSVIGLLGKTLENEEAVSKLRKVRLLLDLL